MTENEVFNELLTLRNELLSAKNLVDQSAEVKTSRRLQGTIARCTVLLTRLNQGQKPDVAQTIGNQENEAVSDG